MAIDVETLAAARTYTDDSLKGVGSVQGKNCTIQEITKEGTTNTVVFGWTDDEGNVSTSEMIVEDGKDGVDGKDGEVGPKGDPGEKGETGETGQTGASAYEVALANGFEGSEEDWLKSLTPTNIVTVSDSPFESHAGSFKVNEIGGKSEQVTTTGKNLWAGGDVSGVTSYKGQQVFDISNIVGVSLNDKITISFNPNGYTGKLNFLTAIGTGYVTSDGVNRVKHSFELLALSGNLLYLEVDSGVSYNFTDVQVEEGTVATDYEPYTGGIPAPNPDYPQEIKKTVVSEIKTHGKNILNTDNVIVYSDTCKKFVIDAPAGGYVFSCSELINNQIKVEYHDDTTENIIPWSWTSTKAFVAPKRIIGVMINTGVTIDFDIYKYQLEEGSVATDYEPYTESTIALSQPIELYGIGDAQDTIEDGKVVKKLESVVFDGSDDEAWQIEQDTDFSRFFIVLNKPILNQSDINVRISKLICSHGAFGRGAEEGTIFGYNDGNNSRFYIYANDILSITDWRAHLQSNPMTLVYEITEEANDLPLTDQSALNQLKTFDNLTYVEFDSEIEPTFSGETALTEEGSHILESLAKSNVLTLEYLDAATYICDNLP